MGCFDHCLYRKPDLVQYKSLNVDVKFKGPSQGRTFIKESGRPIKVVTDVKHDDFFNYITNLAKKVDSPS